MIIFSSYVKLPEGIDEYLLLRVTGIFGMEIK